MFSPLLTKMINKIDTFRYFLKTTTKRITNNERIKTILKQRLLATGQ